MKKTYINPQIDVVVIKAPAILSGSPQFTGDPASTDINGDYNDSRSFDWYDDEDDF